MTVCVIHIMKTGGTSLLSSVYAEIGWERVWGQAPRGEATMEAMVGYTSVEALAEADLDRYDVVTGHLPFVASELVGGLVATVLRDPVERTISYLAHAKRYHAEHRDLPLEAIYEDEWYRPRYMGDHQTKVMAMTMDEALTPTPPPPRQPTADEVELLSGSTMLSLAIADPPIGRVVDLEGRLDDAIANLERVDVLGVQDDYGDFLRRLRAATGWTVEERRLHGRDEVAVPQSLRRRIAEDTALDAALVDAARGLLARR